MMWNFRSLELLFHGTFDLMRQSSMERSHPNPHHELLVIYTDVEKALPNRLTGKLSLYGIDEALVKWVGAFLLHRKHIGLE